MYGPLCERSSTRQGQYRCLRVSSPTPVNGMDSSTMVAGSGTLATSVIVRVDRILPSVAVNVPGPLNVKARVLPKPRKVPGPPAIKHGPDSGEKGAPVMTQFADPPLMLKV